MKLVTADWCSSCKTVKAFIEEGGYDKVLEVDAEDHPQVVRSANIKSLPALLLYDGGSVVGAAKIIQYIKENYDTYPNS